MLYELIENEYQLYDRFRAYGRENSFSLEGLAQIMEYFDEVDNSTGTELDVVAIDCDFTESSPEDIVNDYSNISRIADCKDEDGDINLNKLLEVLNYYTYAVPLHNGNILYINF